MKLACKPGTALLLTDDACPNCLARKSIGMPRLASVYICSWNACQAPKVADSWFCCNREQERGIAMYLHRYMHVSNLVPPITHTEAWWPSGRIAQFNIGWMHLKIQLIPIFIMDNPECRWLGNWDTFRHSEYEMYLVSRARANSYSWQEAICMICNIDTILTYTILW
mgnify:CR=1 FL=1